MSEIEIKESWSNKWGLWYNPHEMVLDAPPNAPEWVKKCWVPVPNHYESKSGVNNSIDCSPPGGALLVGGPQHGQIQPVGPNSSHSIVAAQNVEIVGTYNLQKEAFNFGGIHYHRLIYVFKPNPDMQKKVGEEMKKLELYDKYYVLNKPFKPYKNFNVQASGGTHQSMTFNFEKVNPNILAALYGKSANLDSWHEPEEEEEPDEPALWEQI